jgi:hypothetical protein
MEYPIRTTEELFDYLATIPNVLIRTTSLEENITKHEIYLNNKGWINAISENNFQQSFIELNNKLKKYTNTNYTFNILYSKELIFNSEIESLKIPLFSIEDFLSQLMKGNNSIMPVELKSYNILKDLNYYLINQIDEFIKVKKEKHKLKSEYDELLNDFYKLRSENEYLKKYQIELKETNKDQLENIVKLASDVIISKKLLPKGQINVLKTIYSNYASDFNRDCTVTFYSDKSISLVFNEYYSRVIEGILDYVPSSKYTYLFINKAGGNIKKDEILGEILFNMKWRTLYEIIKIKLN